MTATDVSQLIASEIAAAGEEWFAEPQNNSHGLDIARCLIAPTRVTCTNVLPGEREGERFEAWLVLEELPGSDDGYRIVFDAEARQFGLACGSRDNLTFIGLYGSFLDTVQGM